MSSGDEPFTVRICLNITMSSLGVSELMEIEEHKVGTS